MVLNVINFLSDNNLHKSSLFFKYTFTFLHLTHVIYYSIFEILSFKLSKFMGRLTSNHDRSNTDIRYKGYDIIIWYRDLKIDCQIKYLY